MTNTWGSTNWGAAITRSETWQITLNGDVILVRKGRNAYQLHILDAQSISAKSGYIWTAITLAPQNCTLIDLDGIPNASATEMLSVLRTARTTYLSEEAKKKRRLQFENLLSTVIEWCRHVVDSARNHRQERRWIAEETLQAWISKRPTVDANGVSLSQLLQDTDITTHLATKPEDARNAIELWKYDLRSEVNALNQKHLQAELVACKDFFEKVEKSPLTEEQAKAVVCFDNRVMVIASAGSGKTSTMVAKAGYALHRGLVDADRILLMAFNTDAAEELQKRIVDRLTPMGLPANKVVARTFHSFGLSVIGKATGKKPSLAPWLEHGGDIARLSDLIDGLKDRDAAFRTKWDMFRVVFSRDLPRFGKENDSPEDWDRGSKQTGFRTLHNEVVKSHGERLIADWLFYNGIDYRYEPSYEVDTADETHRQYRPDFYYPDANIYHEHLALDSKGNPPADFAGYLESIEWKRSLHKKQGTMLVETTSAELRTGKAFAAIEAALKKRGVALDPNPDRPIPGRKVIEHLELVKTFRTFLTHAKSNQLTGTHLRDRLKMQPADAFTFRHEMFLDLFEVIRAEWENCLKTERVIDFEDMLNLAADHLEAGDWQSPFQLVMVDEFQDASRARSRLTRALVNQPGRYLFAVGDDWQSINRFAGSDIAAMTDFESWFGKGHTLRLERTFRCPQSLCDISSQFIQKNKAQLPKKVVSKRTEFPPTIQAWQVKGDEQIQGAVDQYLESLYKGIRDGSIPTPTKDKISVFVLGRYKKDRQYVPSTWLRRFGDLLTVKFSTIHGSKGLEADYVILPRLVRSFYSFPSTIEDDPVLQLAMPSNDDYPFAEERRLMYVALTRARRSVAVITTEGNVSEFLVELIADQHLELLDSEGKPSASEPCPKCSTGLIVTKPGKYGAFESCNRWPKCDYKVNRGSKTSGYNKSSRRARSYVCGQ